MQFLMQQLHLRFNYIGLAVENHAWEEQYLNGESTIIVTPTTHGLWECQDDELWTPTHL